MKHGKAMEFTHVHVADVFPIELTIYAPNELSHRPRSSTDGKPIVRLRAATVRKLCEREHPELWSRYCATGAVPTLQEIFEAEDADDRESLAPAPALELDEEESLASWESSPAFEAEEQEPERESRIRRPPRKGRGRFMSER